MAAMRIGGPVMDENGTRKSEESGILERVLSKVWRVNTA